MRKCFVFTYSVRFILALVIALVPSLATAQKLESREYVVPSSFYVQHQCSTYQDMSRTLFLRTPLERANLAQQLTGIETLCKDYSHHQIDGDQWLSLVEPIRDQISATLPRETTIRISTSHEAVPAGYGAYAILLIPNFASQFQRTRMMRLRAAFFDLGQSIGNKKLAIWLGADNHTDLYNYDESRWYCDRFGLDYMRGPYIVVTAARPDKWRPSEEFLEVRLTNLSPSGMISVIETLDQALRRNQEGSPSGRWVLLYEEIKNRLLSPDYKRIFSEIVSVIQGRR